MQPGVGAAYVGFIHGYIAQGLIYADKISTSLYKIFASITEKHASALYQLVIAVRWMVILKSHTRTDTEMVMVRILEKNVNGLKVRQRK